MTCGQKTSSKTAWSAESSIQIHYGDGLNDVERRSSIQLYASRRGQRLMRLVRHSTR